MKHRPAPDRQANYNPDRRTAPESAWLYRRFVATGRHLRPKDPGGHLLPRDPVNSYVVAGTRDPDESPVWAQAGNLIDDAFDRFEGMGQDTPTWYLRQQADDVGISWAEIQRAGARKGIRKYKLKGRWWWQRGEEKD